MSAAQTPPEWMDSTFSTFAPEPINRHGFFRSLFRLDAPERRSLAEVLATMNAPYPGQQLELFP